ncbi:toll/interleukin-1 receptor domain-containing protein [Lentzea sp. NEAU-D13]|uniref:Toll/interleukin-1 receptor domain-containing protein n=1 Tax=Lentzea alba TaxID=2714351 RepID=A0A7C9RUG9_9PSEU|nr:toll/interleukin-1 receptor domain-containing protein [Lentzea alba]NGY60962.1 toll/interleukin-1 receptor domain-containing protein [Lentzea alba]
MGYEYDVFLSYTRRGGGEMWVREHFHRALKDWLGNEMGFDPRIFVDWGQETGVAWPENLERALLRSKVMVAVFSPPYFRSPWCRAEWESMLERHRVLGYGTADQPRQLVLPVRYADGRHYPPEAHATQQRDFTSWNLPLAYEVYSRSANYEHFLTAVQELAKEVAERIEEAPPWDPAWQVVRPPLDLTTVPPGPLPRL